MIIRAQPGPQERFLSSSSDIAIYGGAAGGGKSFGLLLEPLRHVANPQFGGVIFRRTSPQITNEGALWDQASRVYPLLGAEPRVGALEYRFPSTATVAFRHLVHEHTKFDWQGSEVPYIGFDELTHFSKSQFFYLLSRNRSTCGVRPYIRATCNPDSDSWVAEFIAWWIDQDTGLPIPERAGMVRYFVRLNDAIVWGDTPDEVMPSVGDDYGGAVPKSVTFIPARLSDNPILMKADPAYLANLLSLPTVERERLLGGNWKIRAAAGLYFQRGRCEIVDAVPAGLTVCRGWDLAATPKTEHNDPDWTTATKIGRSKDGLFYVLDQIWLQGAPEQVRKLIFNTAVADTRAVNISIPQDPGAGGKALALDYTRMLAGWNVSATPEARNLGGDPTPAGQSAKVTRFAPFSAQAMAGNVKVLRAPWNTRWFEELEAFPEARHDDAPDSTSRAFNSLIAPLGPPTLVRMHGF